MRFACAIASLHAPFVSSRRFSAVPQADRINGEILLFLKQNLSTTRPETRFFGQFLLKSKDFF
ncbi:MAG TPA: hypothetical protein DDW76_05635 [Cyanobacteria bacterium UBA11369]|nr:hypothetical protein [Cyanobacteria bacterium UBA11368]HBE48288.1 hypothetical protein [Cyanobacteria bacterium UBA11369]